MTRSLITCVSVTTILMLTGCSETRTDRAQLVVNACVPVRLFTLEFVI